ncbi:hypothetical protein HMPREF3213_03753 [Heyndrickxia coagulans]|uniref:Uncharacterized protein n=1 Tax=Heyndrickxia coagulans TaxID=1398 RepID=A0A133KAD2_HEYCO|nr:hypothetical protein HMPREF3213_03753 [Heyndrickxia coagulans]
MKTQFWRYKITYKKTLFQNMLLLKPDPIQYTRGKWPKLNKKRAGFYATK